MSKFFELIAKWREARSELVNASGNVTATAAASARVTVPAMQLSSLVADTKWSELREALQTWKQACQAVEEALRPLEEFGSDARDVAAYDGACLDQDAAAHALAQAISKLNLF